MVTRTCSHFENLASVADPASSVCDRCVEIGDTWVHLRSCLSCGTVGCCDQSKNRHARQHWEGHHHPLIQSIEPGETWRYCFQDRYLVK